MLLGCPIRRRGFLTRSNWPMSVLIRTAARLSPNMPLVSRSSVDAKRGWLKTRAYATKAIIQ